MGDRVRQQRNGATMVADLVATNSDAFSNVVAANAHATDELTNGTCRGIYVSAAGDVVCRFEGGASDQTIPVVANTYHPWRLTHVRDTTTATVWVGY